MVFALHTNPMILLHDYGIWERVTRALEDLESDEKLWLSDVCGTSLG